MDCVMTMAVFNFIFLQSVVLRDQIDQESAYKQAIQLSDAEKAAVMESIAARFGL